MFLKQDRIYQTKQARKINFLSKYNAKMYCECKVTNVD